MMRQKMHILVQMIVLPVETVFVLVMKHLRLVQMIVLSVEMDRRHEVKYVMMEI